MRNGKNILRMQADEEDVYHLMDLRERYFVLIPASDLEKQKISRDSLYKGACSDQYKIPFP